MSFKNFINFKEKVFILIKFGTKYTFLWIEGPLWNFGSLAADGLKSHIRWTRLVIWAWICFFLLWVRLITWLLTFQILSANRVRLTRPTTSLSNQWQTGSPTLLEHSQTLLSLSLSLSLPKLHGWKLWALPPPLITSTTATDGGSALFSFSDRPTLDFAQTQTQTCRAPPL